MQNELSDLRQRVAPMNSKDENSAGSFQPFKKPALGLIGTLLTELRPVMKEPAAKKVVWLMVGNIICSSVLSYWSRSSGSLALNAFTQLTLFDLLCLGNCLLGMWVSQQKPGPTYSFGYRRWEALAILASTILSQLGSFLVLKER
ncbi:zinc transporter 6-like [Rhipicephalus microplus]|uniref:zinc transporter 6-like n=1 Tax=Rhipicephalus microplus TaxID=6941 RepID=UPI003F6D04E3